MRDREDYERRKRAKQERQAKQDKERRREGRREVTREREKGNNDYEVRRRARIARHARQEEERRRAEGQGRRTQLASLHHFPPLARQGNGRRGAPAPRTWA